MYAREGVELDRATLADWVGPAVFLLAPLAEAIGRHVLAGAVLHADDTTIPVLVPGLGRTRTGRLWVVVRDERPWGSGVPPATVYRYSPDRRLCMPRRCPVPAEASCTQMATPGSANSTSLRGLATTRRCSRWPAGAMCAANSMTCTMPLPRRLRLRPCSGSPPCSPLRAASAAVTRAPAGRAPATRPSAARSAGGVSRHRAQPGQWQEYARTGHPLCTVEMAGARTLPDRRAAGDVEQCRRARDEVPGSWQKELSLLWLRRRPPARRLHLHHHRDLPMPRTA